MKFRDKFGGLSTKRAVAAIVGILLEKGEDIDVRSFTWTVVGALFENKTIEEEEFLARYEMLMNDDKLLAEYERLVMEMVGGDTKQRGTQ